ncbi:MAG TPA: choice-of-anchor D domain-containing protein, partial [Longimicrobium sp.]|nr:choice-of-anchor D domain-containing protein [Longimicrobium sp.]
DRSGGELYDFGDAGMAVDHTFTVTNRGATAATTVVPAAGLANGFNHKGGAYPGTGGTCGTTLAAGASCTVVVTFTPAGTGDRYATLALSYHDGAAGRFASQELTATSVAQAALSITDCPGCQPSPEPYDYGPRGLLLDHVFTVTNTGPVAATGIANGGGFRNGFNFKNGSYPGTGGTCTSTLAPGASCAVVVTFTPSGERVRTGALTLAYNDGAASRTATRELRAEASTVAVLTMSDCPDCQSSMTPSLVDFGTSGITVDRTFYVTNIGAQTASNMSGSGGYQRFEFKGGYYPGTGGTCGGTLAPGISCTVVMSFIPSNSGPNTEVMSVRYDGLRQYVTRPLVGTPTTRALLNLVDCPTCTATSAAYDFGTAGVTAERTLYVRNVGAVGATSIANGGTLGNGFAFKGGAFPGTGGTCGTSLSSAASCAVVVTFTPSGTGTRQSSLSINYNDGGAARTATRAVTAAITSRSFLVVSELSTPGGCGDACGPYDFGSALVGSTVERTFTVFNTGAIATSGVGDAGVLAPPFGFKGGGFPGTGGTCGNVINAGGSCTLVVRFSPGVVGTSHGSVTLGYVDAQGTQQAGRAVRGVGQ